MAFYFRPGDFEFKYQLEPLEYNCEMSCQYLYDHIFVQLGYNCNLFMDYNGEQYPIDPAWKVGDVFPFKGDHQLLVFVQNVATYQMQTNQTALEQQTTQIEDQLEKTLQIYLNSDLLGQSAISPGIKLIDIVNQIPIQEGQYIKAYGLYSSDWKLITNEKNTQIYDLLTNTGIYLYIQTVSVEQNMEQAQHQQYQQQQYQNNAQQQQSIVEKLQPQFGQFDQPIQYQQQEKKLIVHVCVNSNYLPSLEVLSSLTIQDVIEQQIYYQIMNQLSIPNVQQYGLYTEQSILIPSQLTNKLNEITTDTKPVILNIETAAASQIQQQAYQLDYPPLNNQPQQQASEGQQKQHQDSIQKVVSGQNQSPSISASDKSQPDQQLSQNQQQQQQETNVEQQNKHQDSIQKVMSGQNQSPSITSSQVPLQQQTNQQHKSQMNQEQNNSPSSSTPQIQEAQTDLHLHQNDQSLRPIICQNSQQQQPANSRSNDLLFSEQTRIIQNPEPPSQPTPSARAKLAIKGLIVLDNCSLFVDKDGEYVIFKFHPPISVQGCLKKAQSKNPKSNVQLQEDKWVTVDKVKFTKFSDFYFAVKWDNGNISTLKFKQL